jgi:hypothetical protein
MRYLGLGDTHDVPEATQWAGAHLSWLAEHALFPGQSIFLAATELLERHFVTGQSELENENLASLLAWIDNDPRQGLTQILAADETALGPVPDPVWEASLEPLVKAWTEHQRAGDQAGMAKAAARVEALVAPKLREAYEATWKALDRARQIPVAGSVASRWETDKRQWGAHALRAEQRIPRFARRHDVLRAAYMMEEWSGALEQLAFHEAIDDPLVLAELDAAGRCVSGKVCEVNLENHEVKPGNKNKTLVPILHIELAGPSTLLVEDSVLWAGKPTVRAEIRSIDEGKAVLAVLSGHKHGALLPARGSTAVFAAMSTFGGQSPTGPDEVPWTHRVAEEAIEPDDVGEADDGSPDLSAGELLGLPVVGVIGSDAVPGVVL